MLIGHLLPGVKFIFLSPPLPPSAHPCSLPLWLAELPLRWNQLSVQACTIPSIKHAHVRAWKLYAAHCLRGNLHDWQETCTQMQHIEVVASSVSCKRLKLSAGAVRQAVKPPSITENMNFQAVNMQYTGCSSCLQCRYRITHCHLAVAFIQSASQFCNSLNFQCGTKSNI